MGPPVVVPPDPSPHRPARLDEAREAVLPNALLLEATKEALDHPVLLRRVRNDVLLLEAVAAHHGHEDLRAEDEAVVTPQDERLVLVADAAVPERVFQGCRGNVRDPRP
jgi:hypothetical protein